MFDIGFWELSLIGVITLLVVGPERLPRLARTAGLWFGKARYFVASVKADIDKEIRADELKRIMEEQARSAGVHEIIEETRGTLEKTRTELEETRSQLETTAETPNQSTNAVPADDKPADSTPPTPRDSTP